MSTSPEENLVFLQKNERFRHKKTPSRARDGVILPKPFCSTLLQPVKRTSGYAQQLAMFIFDRRLGKQDAPAFPHVTGHRDQFASGRRLQIRCLQFQRNIRGRLIPKIKCPMAVSAIYVYIPP